MCQLPTYANLEEQTLASEELRFIYDKHLDLFNVRREHEWRVFFGMITLIGLSSAALLNYHIDLTLTQEKLWTVGMVALFIVHFLYQHGVQRRNRIDRIVMDEVTQHICALMKLDNTCYLRLAVDAGAEQVVVTGTSILGRWYSSRYMWAFILQNVTVLIVCFFSLLVAWGGVINKKTLGINKANHATVLVSAVSFLR